MTGVGDVAGGILANLRVEGLLKVTGKALTGDGLSLTSDKLKGKLSLLVDLDHRPLRRRPLGRPDPLPHPRPRHRRRAPPN